jgi:hypothetical protein
LLSVKRSDFLKGNVEGNENTLLSSLKKMFKENQKTITSRKKNMQDILVNGIVMERNNAYEEKSIAYDRKHGQTIEENNIFYLCGILVN